MAHVLDISEAVVTEQVLDSRHAGEAEVRVGPGAVVTPSGWDYLRFHRLRLTRGGSTGQPAPHPAVNRVGVAAAIPEVLPPGSEAGVLSRGRCDHPDRAYGCRTEEFGSGFVEPSSCSDCAIHKAQQSGAANSGCDGCNKADSLDHDVEALVQNLTNEIMRRLGRH
jgi:hypothetical protein